MRYAIFWTIDEMRYLLLGTLLRITYMTYVNRYKGFVLIICTKNGTNAPFHDCVITDLITLILLMKTVCASSVMTSLPRRTLLLLNLVSTRPKHKRKRILSHQWSQNWISGVKLNFNPLTPRRTLVAPFTKISILF